MNREYVSGAKGIFRGSFMVDVGLEVAGQS